MREIKVRRNDGTGTEWPVNLIGAEGGCPRSRGKIIRWHRVREGYKTESLAIGNRLRGLLAKFGIVIANSDAALRRALADLDQDTALPAELKELLRDLSAHWAQVRTAFDACDARIGAVPRRPRRPPC